MEEVREHVCDEDSKWEKFGSEYKLKKQFLCDEATMWFNFIKYSLLPTSHTTNVEKERLTVIDAIMAREKIDVGRLISKEIEKCRTKKGGNIYFPCLITKLCIRAEVEVEAKEERRSPAGAFPSFFKPKQRPAAPASGDAATLPRLTLQQQTLSLFVKKQFEWEKAMFAQLSKGKTIIEAPEFLEWLIDEDPKKKVIIDEPKQKKRVKTPPKKQKPSPAKKKQKVSSEEEDVLNSEDLEDISEGDEAEAKTLMKEMESEEDEEDSSEETSEEEEEEEEKEEEEIHCDPVPNPKKLHKPSVKAPSPPSNKITIPETPKSPPPSSTIIPETPQTPTQPPQNTFIPQAAEPIPTQDNPPQEDPVINEPPQQPNQM